jgi:hypothetical protein
LLNAGLPGTLASADDNSFCSSAEGAHTLMTFTFTGGCWAEAGTTIAKAAVTIRIL